MALEHHGGDLVAVGRRPVDIPASVADADLIPTGEFRLHNPDPIGSLAPAGEPRWWWAPLLPFRAALMFLLWGTRSPSHAAIAGTGLAAIALAVLIVRGLA